MAEADETDVLDSYQGQPGRLRAEQTRRPRRRGGRAAPLYRFTFDSIESPARRTIETAVDPADPTRTEGATARSFGNMVVDAAGNILV